MASSSAQVVTEDFSGTSGSTPAGWVFAGSGYTPNLTGAADDGGWLRLTGNGNNQATSAYYDTALTATSATIYASFEFASWGGSGADGITFFLFDGSETFSIGADGGSMGYAQKTGVSGLAGGYIGVAIDEFGNFSNPTEGRVGGTGFAPDSISVRGSEDADYVFLGGSGTLPTSIDAPYAGSRPTTFNEVQVLMNATNQLTVTLQQDGVSPQTVLQMDLSSYARPETLKLGFTAGTGGSTNYHEVRNFEASTVVASLWDNQGDSTWGNNNNWNPTVVPTIGEDVLFDNSFVSTDQTIDTEADRTLRSITFDAPQDYTINNNTITLDNNGVAGFSGVAVTQTHGSGDHTINSDIDLANDIYVRNSAAGSLTLNGDLDTNGNMVTFDGTGASTTVDGVISGSGDVVKNDAGSVTFAETNTYTGGTTINDGTLMADADGALGTGAVSLAGGTLGSTNNSTVSNTISLSGDAGLNGITSGGTLTQVDGSYSLGFSGTTQTGDVNISNSNTGQTLTLNVATDSSIAGVIANGGSGAGDLTKEGAGVLTLSGANTYTGTTTINDGTVQLGGSDRLADAADLVIAAGGTLDLNGYSERVDNLTAEGGAAIDFGAASGANTFVFDTYTEPSSGVLVINNWEDGLDQLATTVDGQSVDSVYISGYGVAQVDGSTSSLNAGYGSGYLLTPDMATTKEWDGSSSANWSTNSNWTPTREPNSTQVALFDDLGLGQTSINLNSSYTIAGFEFGENATSTYNISSTTSDITLTGAVPYIQQKSDVTQELYFDDLFLGNNTVVDITGDGDLVINADLKETGGSHALIKDGTGDGKLILNSNYNSFSGGLYVNNGIVQVQHSTSLGTGTAHIAEGAALEISNTGVINEAIMVAGEGVGDTGAIRNVAGNNTLSGTITQTGTTQFNADSGTTLALTGNLTGADTDTIFVGDITASRITTGSGAVTVESGDVTFTGGNANTYTGVTTVDGGTLTLNKTAGVNAIGSGGLVVNSGATTTLQQNNQISDDASVTLNGTGSLDLNNRSETVAQLNSASSTSTVVLGSGNLTVGAPTVINSNFEGSITGSGTFNVDGAGTVYLSGDSTGGTFTTNVDSGSLNISGYDEVLGSGNVIVDDGGALQIQGGLDIDNAISISGTGTSSNGALQNFAGENTVSGVVSGTGSVNVSSGQLTLSNDNTYSGDVFVATGATLVATADDALGSGGGNTTVANGGTLEVSGGVDIDTEDNIYLAGVGVTSDGALLNTSGTNIVDTPITLTADTTIGATGGTLNLGTQGNDPELNLDGFDLTLNTDGGDILVESDFTGTGDIYKTGSGTLTLNHGEAFPAILSTDTDFFLTDGTTILNTYANENSGMRGDVTIGDGTGAAGSAVLQQGILESGADNSSEIIADTSNITINSDGYWDLQGHRETVNNVTMNGGTIDAKMDVGDSDRLDIGGTLQATADASINGLLGLDDQTAASVIVDSGATLDINAILSNGGFDKTGDGTLILSGANTYTGNTEISNGIVIVDNDSGLGSVGSSYTRVDSGAQLQLANVDIGNEPLKLSGTGHNGDGTGALLATTGTNIVGGAVDLEANTEIQTNSGATLAINGDITGSGNTLTVDSIGNTTFAGNNTFNTLEKNGAGSLTVTGTNTYATANVNSGTFALGNSNILADTMDVNLGSSGTFAVGTYAETIDDLNGSGTLTIASGGSLGIDKLGNSGAFTGDLDVDGIMTLNGGLIGTGADGSLSSGTMVLSASSTLEIAADFDFGGTLELTANTTLKLTGAGTEFNLETLHITGDSIIDFSDVDATTFNIGSLVIDPGVSVSAIGWESFYDLWTATNFSGATLDESGSTTSQITFNGFNASDTIWLTYDNGANEITVPEPSTYGALLMGSALAGYLLRRRRVRVRSGAVEKV